jgi:hypothetical protein
VKSQAGKAVGKVVIRTEGGLGLGMVRLKEGLGAEGPLSLGEARVAVAKPAWWPRDMEGKKANV